MKRSPKNKTITQKEHSLMHSLHLLQKLIWRKKKKEEKKDETDWKNEEISGWKAHTNTWKLTWNVLMITDAFLNQKRVNAYIYIYSLLIEKDICDHWNVSVKLPCVCVCLSSRDFFIFSVRFSPFCSYFWCYLHFSTFLPTWSLSQ